MGTDKRNREIYKRFGKEFDEQQRYIVETGGSYLYPYYVVKDRTWDGACAVVTKDGDDVEYKISQSLKAYDIEKLNELKAYVEG